MWALDFVCFFHIYYYVTHFSVFAPSEVKAGDIVIRKRKKNNLGFGKTVTLHWWWLILANLSVIISVFSLKHSMWHTEAPAELRCLSSFCALKVLSLSLPEVRSNFQASRHTCLHLKIDQTAGLELWSKGLTFSPLLPPETGSNLPV